MSDETVDRRTLLKGLGAGVLAAGSYPASVSAAEGGLTTAATLQKETITKEIPSTGEEIVAVGMGTWQTFNVGGDDKLRRDRLQVLRAFFEHDGQMIDSSPMYGSSQSVVGWGLVKLGLPDQLFSADKIWTRDGGATRSQLTATGDEWNVDTFDLMQVHNLLSWKAHLETLEALKQEGVIRYVGITTSHGRRHSEFARVMKNHDLDFVQLTYNLGNRTVENELLPLAEEQDIAVIANRPYAGGRLVDRYQDRHELPGWASDYDIANWPQFLLKFIISHPAVTCAIPATTKVEHMRENMGAAHGVLPDAEGRQRMITYTDSL